MNGDSSAAGGLAATPARRPLLSWVFVAAGLIVLAGSVWVGVRYPGDGRRVVSGTRVDLPRETAKVTCEVLGPKGGFEPYGGPGCGVKLPATPDGAVMSGRFTEPGTYRLVPVLSSGDAEKQIILTVIPAKASWLAALGILLLILFLPPAISPADLVQDVNGRAVSVWYRMLSELPASGYSLSRFQLLVWFIPAVVLYAMVSIPASGFADLPTSLLMLLGLSAATTAVGGATSPPQPRTRTPIPKADLSDIIRDWPSEQPDVTRYQYLVLAVVGSLVIIAGFLDGMRMPPVPEVFLTLVGGSQAIYLGTKFWKGSRMPQT